MNARNPLTFLLIVVLLISLTGCDWSVEAVRDGAQDFITERTMMLLEMLVPG